METHRRHPFAGCNRDSHLLAFLLIVILIMVPGCREKKKEVAQNTTRASQIKYADAVSRIEDLSEQLAKSDDFRHGLVKKLRLETDVLETHIAAWIAGKESEAKFVNVNLRAKGLDRGGFKSTFKSTKIRIARWRKTNSAPEFLGGRALRQAVLTALTPWNKATDLHIELFPANIEIEPTQVTAQIVAEIYGKIDDKTGRQASALWKTKWDVDEFKENLSLVEFDILAQEEVVNYANGGKLLLDSTGDILRRCESATNQLGVGIDGWARVSPGVDLTGTCGLAVGDINRDGLDDVYLCQPHGLPNLLLIQNPDGSVDSMGAKLGVDLLDESRSVLMIDIDNDGDQDLAIATDEALVLMSQREDGKFQLEHQLAIGRDASSLSAADFDQDGDLDLFLCKYWGPQSNDRLLPQANSLRQASNGGRNTLLRNDEGWIFKDVTEQVGMAENNQMFSRSAVWADHDRDGDQDLFVANEFGPDQLFENEGGWFQDIAQELKLTAPGMSRSVATGDFNRDGKFDFFVASHSPTGTMNSMLQIPSSRKTETGKALTRRSRIWYSTKRDTYDDYALPAPIFSPQSPMGCIAADLNNDGLDDVLVTNGFISRDPEQYADPLIVRKIFSKLFDLPDGLSEQKEKRIEQLFEETVPQTAELIRKGFSLAGFERNRCYLSIGSMGFANFSGVAGFDFLDDGRGIATCDWDNDGDVDVLTTSRSSPQFRILCNQSQSGNHFLHFDLVGLTSNRDAIGSRIELHLTGSGRPMVKTVSAGSGCLSQSSKRIIFGLGKQKSVNKVVVTWPNGKAQEFSDIQSDRHYQLIEGKPDAKELTNTRDAVVKIKPTPAVALSRPRGVSRSVFYPTAVLPFLEYQVSPTDWRAVATNKDKPLLLVLWKQNGSGQLLLERVTDAEEALKAEGIDVLGICCDHDESPETGLRIAASLVEQTQFPFTWGTIAESSLQKLSVMFGHCFGQQNLYPLPIAVLVSPEGRLISAYSARQFSRSQIALDAKVNVNVESTVQAGFEKGLWISRYRRGRFIAEANKMAERGFDRDYERLIKISTEGQAIDLTNLARVQHARNSLDEARINYEKAIALDNRSVPAYLGMGQYLLEVAFLEKEPEQRQLVLQQAKDHFKMASLYDPRCVDAILGQCRVALGLDEKDQAIASLKEYLEVDPERAEIHAAIGRLYFFQRRFVDATKHLVTAFQSRPTLPNVAGDLGRLYLNNGEFLAAAKHLRLAHRIQPSDKSIRRHLIDAELFTKNFDEAIQHARDVTQAQPTDTRPKWVLSWLYATSPFEGARNGKAGLELITPLVDMFGDREPTVLEIAAACHAETGDFDSAVELQRRALDMLKDPNVTSGYTDKQKSGAEKRVQLYQRSRPFRMDDVDEIPIGPPKV